MQLRCFGWALAVSLTSIASTSAFDGRIEPFAVSSYWPDCVGKTCCDDYFAKCLPTIYPVHGCELDTYCPKPLPRVVSLTCFECDDYCRKPLPKPRCPSRFQLKSFPAAAAGSSGKEKQSGWGFIWW